MKQKNITRIIAQLVRKYGYPHRKLSPWEYEAVLKEAHARVFKTTKKQSHAKAQS